MTPLLLTLYIIHAALGIAVGAVLLAVVYLIVSAIIGWVRN